MRVSELDYELPEELIAQRPVSPRDASRLMVVDVVSGGISHHVFRELPKFLASGDALVLNETKVIPARLAARKETGGEVELLFLREIESGKDASLWEALARPGRRLREGMRLFAGGEEVRIAGRLAGGHWVLEAPDVPGLLARLGHIPLPPYIESTPEAERAYQTVYACEEGSAAAPTAGFHFTEEVLAACRAAGAEVARTTLHVGAGTFSPVRCARLEEHAMHAEPYRVPDKAAQTIQASGRMVAVGTTVARALETWAQTGEREGESELFIYPGYRWRAVDVLLTNFHLPRSTLLAMVMSFGDVELVREAYRQAVARRYRFYSFGDAMLLLGGGRRREETS